MRIVLKLERFDNVGYARYMGHDKSNCWVARLTGFDDKWFFRREFVRGQADWSQAKTTGSRGIFVYYALSPGIYEINERTSWKRVRRYFIRVKSEIEEISKEEVIQCLSEISESTCSKPHSNG
jgi:hypothetical protein